MSDHFLVVAWLKLVSGWRSAGRMEGVRCVGVLRNDGGCCATMREKLERVESPGAYVTE